MGGGSASLSLSSAGVWGCRKLKIVQKLKDLHSQRAVPQKQQMWWDLGSVKWNQICSESNFSWHQLVWKRLIWTGCCYRLRCSDTWDHLSNNVLCNITLEFGKILPPKTSTWLAANGCGFLCCSTSFEGTDQSKRKWPISFTCCRCWPSTFWKNEWWPKWIQMTRWKHTGLQMY